jgi:hypothetical protein
MVLWDAAALAVCRLDEMVLVVAVGLDSLLEETLDLVAVLANFDECKIQIIAESMFYIFFSYFSPY